MLLSVPPTNSDQRLSELCGMCRNLAWRERVIERNAGDLSRRSVVLSLEIACQSRHKSCSKLNRDDKLVQRCLCL